MPVSCQTWFIMIMMIFFFFSLFQMPMGPTRMAPPNVAQMQNQYHPSGQFQVSSPVVSSGPVGVTQPGPQGGMAQVRKEILIWSLGQTL